MRTDIHRPSEIIPEDYDFVCVQFLWQTSDPDLGEVIYNREQQQIFWEHKKKTGGRFAAIEHGGTCFCCGATARYVARYYHEKTNSYIDLGERCSIKLDDGNKAAFNTLRRAIANARDAIAGKHKAKLILADLKMEQAWGIFELAGTPDKFEESRVKDLVGRLVRFGNLTEKQIIFLGNLLHKINHRAEIAEQRRLEKEAAAPCPSGRLVISGTVLTTKIIEGGFGPTLKMLVKADEGFTVWGTVPASLEAERGSRVMFRATVKPSDSDPKHGFFSRPTLV